MSVNRIAVYARHTARAGRRCWDDDVFVLEGSDAELVEVVLRMAAEAQRDPSGYARRLAATIVDAIDAPSVIEAKLAELGATPDELERAFHAYEVDLLLSSDGTWRGVLEAVRRDTDAAA